MIYQENKWIINENSLLIEKKNNKIIYFNIDFPIPTSIKIITSCDLLVQDLINLYGCTRSPLNEIISKFYILNKKFHPRFNSEKQNVGLIWKDEIYFYCKPDIGLIKSVTFGIYSNHLIEKDYFPIHGSLFKVSGNGLVFYGGQNVGKTTVLKKFIDNDDFIFGTDDWLVVKWKKNKLIGYVVEKYISRTINDIDNDFFVKSLTNPSKEYSHRKKIYENCINKIIINKIFYLSRSKERNSSRLLKYEFIESIISSVYHCPLQNENKLINFWNEVYKYLTPIYKIDIQTNNFEFLKIR